MIGASQRNVVQVSRTAGRVGRRSSRQLTHAAIGSALVSVTILASCGGSSGGAPSKIAIVAYCLRKGGIVLSSTGPVELQREMTPTQFGATLQRCGVATGHYSGLLEIGPSNGAKRAAVERELVKQVSCLQEHGFHVTATENEEQKLFNANGVNTRSARFRAASTRCRERFVAEVRSLGPGYGLEHARPKTSESGRVLGSQGEGSAILAECARKYGAEVIEAAGAVGLRVPSGKSDTQVAALIKTCESG
jgi:hypothetical protein